jgi:hypothetical protein
MAAEEGAMSLTRMLAEGHPFVVCRHDCEFMTLKVAGK